MLIKNFDLSEPNITIPVWQLISIIAAILAPFGFAVYWITRKITKLESKIKKLENNELLIAFKEDTLRRARSLFPDEQRVNKWEDQKINEQQEHKGENKEK